MFGTRTVGALTCETVLVLGFTAGTDGPWLALPVLLPLPTLAANTGETNASVSATARIMAWRIGYPLDAARLPLRIK